MTLRDSDLSPQEIETLRALNIRDVETLLSMLTIPTGEAALSRVLNLSLDAVRKLASRLRDQFPDLVVNPVSDAFYAMGHRIPKGTR